MQSQQTKELLHTISWYKTYCNNLQSTLKVHIKDTYAGSQFAYLYYALFLLWKSIDILVQKRKTEVPVFVYSHLLSESSFISFY